jgi:hypothetical protein
MKHVVRAFIGVAAVALLVVGIVSCQLNASSITNTEWTHETVGTGTGLKFTSDTAGNFEAGVVSLWTSTGAFTYTYSALSMSGDITDGSGTKPYSISSNKLIYDGVEYTKK